MGPVHMVEVEVVENDFFFMVSQFQTVCIQLALILFFSQIEMNFSYDLTEILIDKRVPRIH